MSHRGSLRIESLLLLVLVQPLHRIRAGIADRMAFRPITLMTSRFSKEPLRRHAGQVPTRTHHSGNLSSVSSAAAAGVGAAADTPGREDPAPARTSSCGADSGGSVLSLDARGRRLGGRRRTPQRQSIWISSRESRHRPRARLSRLQCDMVHRAALILIHDGCLR